MFEISVLNTVMDCDRFMTSCAQLKISFLHPEKLELDMYKTDIDPDIAPPPRTVEQFDIIEFERNNLDSIFVNENAVEVNESSAS